MSNLTTRVLVGVLGIPLLLALIISGGMIFQAFTILIAVIALWEFYGMFMKKGYNPFRFTMIVFEVIAIVLFDIFGETDFLIIFICVCFAVSAIAQIFRRERRDPMNTAIDIFGLIYIGIPLCMLNSIAMFPKYNAALLVFILIWSSDSFAYFGGRLFGKTPLSEISPKKTLEGSVAGLFMTSGISIGIHFLFPEKFILIDAIVIGTMTGLLSQAGDLFESLIKRYCLEKDSSNINPGHGGVLDRFDSLMFVVPFVYIYLNYFRDDFLLIFS